MPTGDTAYDTSYMNNPSRFDSSPRWAKAGSIPTTQPSTPQKGDIWFDEGSNTLNEYNGTSWNPLSGGGGGGGVTSVNGQTGAVVLKEPNIAQVVVKKTSNYTVTANDDVVLADATSAGFALTLPTAVGFTGMLVLAATTTGTHLVTLNTVGGQTISGSASLTLGTPEAGAPYQTVALVSDNSNWWII